MKVSRSIGKFEPITIVLETKEEADTFWHRFNVAEGRSFLTYRKEYKDVPPGKVGYEMWKNLDAIYVPEGAENG